MTKKITKIGIVVILGASLWCSIATNKKYNNISKKLDIIVENSEKGKIDSLQYEIMYLGNKLDSMQLKYDFGYEF